MLAKFLLAISNRSPSLRRWLWKRWYQYLAGYRLPNWSFMNYGFERTGELDKWLDLEAADEPDRYCIQLYHQVAAAIDLEGLDVLEVGSGRGGGASYVRRYLKPRSLTGADFSPKAVEFCRRTHTIDGLSFVVGDAESLPFEDASFDAVINVESSHCYGSLAAFFGQVKRVLRPGGHFLHADFCPPADADVVRRQLEETGLTMLEAEDITANVVRALELDNARKVALIESHTPRWLSKTFEQFAGVQGSEIYELLRSGALVYRRHRLQKLLGLFFPTV
jgi:ubiquinone/menaquinone biosynthesis C-methylase UbiE